MREFDTGATRDDDDGKLEYAGFLSSTALQAFAGYMHKNRVQSDGKLRSSDNWKKGIPIDAYMHSMWRHFWDVWNLWETGNEVTGHGVSFTDALCALMFNVQGMLHEHLKLDSDAKVWDYMSSLDNANIIDEDWFPETEGDDE